MAIKYAKRKCKNPFCGESFTPRRSNQLYCDEQCKNHYHNHMRAELDATLFTREKRIRHNAKMLQKLYEGRKYSAGVPALIIQHENINLTLYTDKGVNQATNRAIVWCHEYGLELIETIPSKIFLIHKRK